MTTWKYGVIRSKLRRSIQVRDGHCLSTLLINGKIRKAESLEAALRIIKEMPIPGPLAVWHAKPTLVCIGEVGAWKAVPVAHGRWEEMFPLFETYARML